MYAASRDACRQRCSQVTKTKGRIICTRERVCNHTEKFVGWITDNDNLHWGQKYLLADLKRICEQMLAGWLLGKVLFADRKDSAVLC